MATRRVARRNGAAATSRNAAVGTAQAQQDYRDLRLKFEYRDITDIVPYEYNARDNAKAISAVKKSIETYGFIVPCVIDNEGVLVAGHTRVEAAKQLQMTEVPVVYANHLSDEQIRAFRLIDNKVAEIADWDFELLGQEINILVEAGMDMAGYGWSSAEIDCLRSLVSDDCLAPSGLVTEEERETINRAERRAPATTRLVIGEFVFFVPQSQYRTWADGIRQLCDFNEEDIAEELKRRLGFQG